MKLAIVGLGVVGGSLAMGLQGQSAYQIYGIDHNPETISRAQEMGLIIKASHDPKEILPLADCVILCIYPDSIPAFLSDHQSSFKPGAIVVDFAGIKAKILDKIEGILPPNVDYISAHPMAGREKSGLSYASGAVNYGANFLITPLPKNKEKNLLTIEQLAKDAGFGKISRISPKEHDQMIAFTSQLPHALAVALVNSDPHAEQTGRFIGDSYRDFTRIASINGPLWSELFVGNRDCLLTVIDEFSHQLAEIRTAVENGDLASLQRLFEASSVKREEMLKSKP